MDDQDQERSAEESIDQQQGSMELNIDLAAEIQAKSEPLRRLISEVGRVIVGQEKLIERMLVAMISGGHL